MPKKTKKRATKRANKIAWPKKTRDLQTAIVDSTRWNRVKFRAGDVVIDRGLDRFFKGGGATFIHKGTNGRWKDVLSARESARCDEVAARYLTPECARWLKTGKLPH
jgi:hypothetical protein